ncbi:MAG: 4Fe-4S ferredoxin [Bacteroidetes bacterium]|nr:MAG: 4Fe-4S ferredoxin [Bacteroidota bacterium]
MSTHSIAAGKFLANAELAKWQNQTLWQVREKRDRMAGMVPEWEALRQLAHDTKRYAVTHMAEVLEEFERNAEANGVIVHWAKDAKEHNEIVLEILRKHKVKKLVKSKSMLTEECHLDPFLIENGIDTIETDLGERILQLMDAPPSHIVMPAIHIKREEVSDLFHEKWNTEKGNYDPTYLTHAARKSLRHDFITADAAMTGCNFGVASTGEVVVCTNEGNADMGMSCQKVNICSIGLEKVIPDTDALAIFTRLLARSATGQPVTGYTAHFRKPNEGGELHFILVDNGRSEMLADSEHEKTLNCIRCGACLNTCPVYRRTGGYSYTYFIPGPIGINLGMLHGAKQNHGDVSACSLCLSCSNVCPVKVDLGEQIYRWRQRLSPLGLADRKKKMMSKSIGYIMDHPSLFQFAIKRASLANRMPRALVYNGLNDWGKGRELPKFSGQTFDQWWKENGKGRKQNG